MNLTTLFSKFKADNASMKLVQERVFLGPFRSDPVSVDTADSIRRAIATINGATGYNYLVLDIDIVNSFGEVLSHDWDDLTKLPSAACAELYLRTA